MDISSSTSAIKDSFNRIDASAHRVANINTPGFKTELAEEVVEQIKAEKELAANADVIRTQDEMLGEVVDLVAK